MESDYTYKTLDEPRKMIRLLKILSISPHISCELKTVSLEDTLTFSALSYVWGDVDATESVFVDGKSLAIAVNLAQALRGVQHQWTEGNCSTDAEHEQWLWADAICINQQDVQEKNHQVPFMKEIYSSARRVFSWLGPANQETYQGFDTLDLVMREISMFPSYPEVLQTARYKDFYEIKLDDLDAFGSIDWLEKYSNTPSGSSSSLIEFNSIIALFRLPYWNRVWIYQEVALAKDTLLVCGTRVICWLTVRTVVIWHQAFRIHYLERDRPKYLTKSFWLSLLHQLIPLGFFMVDRTKYMLLSRKPNRKFHVSSDLEKRRISPIFHIREVTARHRASNPKDYVYGLSGVTGLAVLPDYSPRTTVAQVYQDFAVQWLTACMHDVEYVSQAGLYDLWFLELAGTGHLWPSVPGLPSWAPNFVGAAETDALHSDRRVVMTEGNSDLAVFANSAGIPKIVSSTCYCKAVFVSQLSEVGPRIDINQSIHFTKNSPNAKFQVWYLWMLDYAVKSLKSHTNGRPVLAAMLQAFSHHAWGKPRKEAYVMLELMLIDLELVCREARGIDRSTFYELLRLAPPARSVTNEHDTDEPTRYQRWYDVCFRLENMRSALFEASIACYMSARQDAINCCMAITDLGHYGMFPPLVQKNDFVCILKGCSVPVVLRKNGDHYIHIGTCYVTGLMRGEASGLLRDGRARMEEIAIR
jgi:hypothetical protein